MSQQTPETVLDNRYRDIFEASEDAIFIHDIDTGVIIVANSRACQLYGYCRDTLRPLNNDEPTAYSLALGLQG